MPYWPGYSDIPDQCRATYLDWLASGRSDASYAPEYLFLYFYGLERRFVVDQPPKAEKREILDEVRRLRQLYPRNGSVQRYLNEFIQLAQNSVDDPMCHEPIFDYRGWELPLSLKIAIGTQLRRGEHLSSEWVLSWLLCHPNRHLQTPAHRCREEFQSLFKLKFHERFPDGLKVNKPKKLLKSIYGAASKEFQAKIDVTPDGEPVPDISELQKPVAIAQEIADEVMDDLDKLSHFLAHNPGDRGSLEAQALLPPDLQPLFPSKKLEQFKSWAGDIAKKGELVPVVDIITRLEGKRPDKLKKHQLTEAADALARIGYGFAPDPRFALRSPKIGEPAVIFDLGENVTQLESVSPTYHLALIEIALGTFIAHADNNLHKKENQFLLDKATEMQGLSDQERRRLVANLNWMLAVPPNMKLLRRKLKDIGPETQATMRATLVSAAHADGVIHPKEITGIVKIYKTLELDSSLAYSDLRAGEATDGPVLVRPAEPGAAGEPVPAEKTAGAIQLDAARIAAIQSDTEQVSKVLSEIFDEAGDDDSQDEVQPKTLEGLDSKYMPLLQEIITKNHWTEENFGNLCMQFDFMASGALETVNEWAYETYGDVLLNEYNGYNVSPEITESLKTKFSINEGA